MSKPEVKRHIIKFLKENYPKDFSLKEITDNTSIHRNTASTYIKVLVAEGRIKVSRTLGNNILYSLSVEESKK